MEDIIQRPYSIDGGSGLLDGGRNSKYLGSGNEICLNPKYEDPFSTTPTTNSSSSSSSSSDPYFTSGFGLCVFKTVFAGLSIFVSIPIIYQLCVFFKEEYYTKKKPPSVVSELREQSKQKRKQPRVRRGKVRAPLKKKSAKMRAEPLVLPRKERTWEGERDRILEQREETPLRANPVAKEGHWWNDSTSSLPKKVLPVNLAKKLENNVEYEVCQFKGGDLYMPVRGSDGVRQGTPIYYAKCNPSFG
ncbi:MAG TPA: hypothetical protein DD400_02555 [Rhodospirillaceae bacterium]|nr:hypothetical protein [Rhodospirillaceae bacterium]